MESSSICPVVFGFFHLADVFKVCLLLLHVACHLRGYIYPGGVFLDVSFVPDRAVSVESPCQADALRDRLLSVMSQHEGVCAP